LRDIVATMVTRAPDMALVATSADETVDVFIELHSERIELRRVPNLLKERARCRVLAVAEAGRESVLWELQPRAVPLVDDLSPEGLLDLIRASVRSRSVRPRRAGDGLPPASTTRPPTCEED
jgi:hypothetical protein